MSTSNDILDLEFSALLKKYNDRVFQDCLDFQEKSYAIMSEYKRRNEEIRRLFPASTKYKPIN